IVDNYATHKHPKGAGLARTASEVPLPLHPDLSLLAQRRRGVLRQADPTAAQAWCLQGHRRFPGRDQPLPGRDQRNPKPFTWTADPNAIIEKVRRSKLALN